MVGTRNYITFDQGFLNMVSKQMAVVSLYIFLFIYCRKLSEFRSVENVSVVVGNCDYLPFIDLIDYLNRLLDQMKCTSPRRPKRATDEVDLVMVYLYIIFS